MWIPADDLKLIMKPLKCLKKERSGLLSLGQNRTRKADTAKQVRQNFCWTRDGMVRDGAVEVVMVGGFWCYRRIHPDDGGQPRVTGSFIFICF